MLRTPCGTPSGATRAVHYVHRANDSNSLPSDYIRAVMHDRSAGTHEPMGRIVAIAPGFAPAGTGAGLPESMASRRLWYALGSTSPKLLFPQQ